MMDTILAIVVSTLTVAADFCFRAMIVVFGIYLAVRWGII